MHYFLIILWMLGSVAVFTIGLWAISELCYTRWLFPGILGAVIGAASFLTALALW